MKLKQKYQSIHASTARNEVLSHMLCDAFDLLKRNSYQYPEQDRWYYRVNVPRVLSGEGEQTVLLDGDKVIAMMSLKLNGEKKLCAIRVDENYQKQGISEILFEEAFELLGTDKPLITISESKLLMFDSVIKQYGWNLTRVNDTEPGKYVEPEYVFNECQTIILPKRKILK